MNRFSIMMFAVIAIIYKSANADEICPNITIPSNLSISSTSCSFWKKNGHYNQIPIDFSSNCYSISPTDVDFHYGNTLIGNTDQKNIALTTTIRLNDCGKEVGILQEDIVSRLNPMRPLEASYKLKDVNEHVIGIINKQALFSSIMTLIHPNTSEILATATISFVGKIERAFCGGGVWKIHFATENQQIRHIFAQVIAWKSLVDTDRDSDGQITRPPCNKVYWFILVGVPIISISVLIMLLAYIKHKCYSKKSNNNNHINFVPAPGSASSLV